MASKYILKYTGDTYRSYWAGKTKFIATYSCWDIFEGDKCIFYKHITANSYLDMLLRKLMGKEDYLELDNSQRLIFKIMLTHSHRWQIFWKALDILNKKGKEETLKFLENKFAILALGEKLRGQ